MALNIDNGIIFNPFDAARYASEYTPGWAASDVAGRFRTTAKALVKKINKHALYAEGLQTSFSWSRPTVQLAVTRLLNEFKKYPKGQVPTGVTGNTKIAIECIVPRANMYIAMLEDASKKMADLLANKTLKKTGEVNSLIALYGTWISQLKRNLPAVAVILGIVSLGLAQVKNAVSSGADQV